MPRSTPCGGSPSSERPDGGLVGSRNHEGRVQRPWQGVTYEAVFYGYRYPCLVAIHHLNMKIGKEALAEFRTRLAEVERATEGILCQAEVEIVTGRRKPGERVIIPLEVNRSGPVIQRLDKVKDGGCGESDTERQ